MKDDTLWIWFSRFIRLRDSDENGIATCFTCGRRLKWDAGIQAGHFIGRREQSTKFDEKNVHAQCVTCNHFNAGMQFEYSLQLDRKYGEGTAMRLLIQSKQICKRGEFEIKELRKYYQKEVARLKKEKNLN